MLGFWYLKVSSNHSKNIESGRKRIFEESNMRPNIEKKHKNENWAPVNTEERFCGPSFVYRREIFFTDTLFQEKTPYDKERALQYQTFIRVSIINISNESWFFP